MVTEKKCFKCGITKVISEFYVHKMMLDGHLNKCKECTKLDVKTAYYLDHEKSKERERKRVRNYTAKAEYGKRYKETFPMKRKAQYLVSNAIRDGRMSKGKECEICEAKERIHAHHNDYAKPLDVRWLCCTCHFKWHKENGEGLNSKATHF